MNGKDMSRETGSRTIWLVDRDGRDRGGVLPLRVLRLRGPRRADDRRTSVVLVADSRPRMPLVHGTSLPGAGPPRGRGGCVVDRNARLIAAGALRWSCGCAR